jgi:hypothetical protein
MQMETISMPAHEWLPETRLWQAVILSAVQDWISGQGRSKREAELYLFHDQTDFPQVCQSAGMDAERLRSRLSRLRVSKAVSDTGKRRN